MAERAMAAAFHRGLSDISRMLGESMPELDLPRTARTAWMSEMTGITEYVIQQLSRIAEAAVLTHLSASAVYSEMSAVINKVLNIRVFALCNVVVVRWCNVGRVEALRLHRPLGRVGVIAEARARTLRRDSAKHHVHVRDKRRPVRASQLVEVLTAGDDDVCEECQDLEGETYTYTEAIGLLPVHPSCRCAIVPAS